MLLVINWKYLTMNYTSCEPSHQSESSPEFEYSKHGIADRECLA